MKHSRRSFSTGPAPSSITARSRRWACSSKPLPSSASPSPSTKRAADGHGEAAAHRSHCWRCRGSPEAWAKRHGHAPTEADIDAVYDVFVPKNIAVAARYADAHSRCRRDRHGSSRATRAQDRLDHRLHPRDHGRDRCRSRRRKGSCPTARLHRRHARRPADALHALQDASRPRRLAGLERASRSTTPRSASPRDSTAAAGRSA